MFEVGDIIVCIDDSGLTKSYPKIYKGYKYVISGIFKCSHCRAWAVQIGLLYSKPISKCMTCKNHNEPQIIACYGPHRFRKIQPNYKVVEVSETILEEARELINQKETVR